MRTLWLSLKMLWHGADTWVLKLKLIGCFVTAIIKGVLYFYVPLSLAWLVEALNKEPERAAYYFWVLFGLSLSMVFIKFIRRFFLESTVSTLPINIKKQYYEKLYGQPYSWHLNNSAGFFLSALNSVCGNLTRWLQKFPDEYIPNAVLGILFLGYTYTISPWLFLFFCVFLSAVVGIATMIYKYRIKIVENLIIKQISFDKMFIDFVNNIRSIKKMGLWDFTSSNINTKKKEFAHQQEYSARYNGIQWLGAELTIELLFLLPIGYFVYQMLATGQGLETIVLLTSVQARIRMLVVNIMHIMEGISETYVQYDILENGLEKISINPKKCPKWKQISFKNTLFEFKKERSAFVHVVDDFVIHKGDKIAVTGKSGEGKSIFLNILTGLLPVQGGSTKIDNKDFCDVGENNFASIMAYVSQDIELFNMTLAENITLGRKVPKKELEKVLRGVCLQELISRVSGNLDVNIGEKGVKVSAGEKQRLNLARGLLLNKDILVLDEITANLDADTTKKIWKFIFTEYKDKTIIAVSHEPELLKYVTRRLCFSDGQGSESM